MERILLPFGKEVRGPGGGTILLGTFDGVHLGHQALVLKARMEGPDPISALLFDKNPAEVLPIGKRKEVLTSMEDKVRLLRGLGVERFYLLSPTLDYMGLPAEEFLGKVLLPLAPRALAFGEDYRFGKEAKGTPSLLREHFPTIESPLLELEGGKVSTQRIGSLLEEGDVVGARRLLGRPYEIQGKVVPGLRNGHRLGFPTMNLSLSAPYLLPKEGVYFSLAHRLGKIYRAIVNVGRNPTIGVLKERKVEAHLLDYPEEEGYGGTLYVEFLSFMREEKTFAGLDGLRKQLEMDKEEARRLPLEL